MQIKGEKMKINEKIFEKKWMKNLKMKCNASSPAHLN